MKPHRPHSPKTVIILILVSVLSFAFVACDSAAQKCYDSRFGKASDREICEKACYDENERDSNLRGYSCGVICNDGANLSACSLACGLADEFDGYRASDCRYPCEHGDTDACKKFERYQKEIERKKKIDKELEAIRAEREAKKAETETTKEFVYDNGWRKTLKASDDEECYNNIIKREFDYDSFDRMSFTAKQLLVNKYANISVELMKTFGADDITKLLLFLVEEEDQVYKNSSGKYKCDYAVTNTEKDLLYINFKKTFLQFAGQQNGVDFTGTNNFTAAYFLYAAMLMVAYDPYVDNKIFTGYNTASDQATNNSNVHINHRERHQIMPVYNAEECKFYKNAKLTPDAKTAPKNLSRFFKSFNPSFYEYAIQRFIENPITVTRTAKTCTMPLDGECYYYEQFFLDSNCSVSISEKNAFITVSDAQKYQLNKGDVFPTCLLDSKKSNKSGTECRGKFKNNSYWQVLEDTPRTIYQWSQGTDSEECNEVRDKVIFVYDQEGIETRRALYNEIELGMQNLNQLCQ